MPGRTSQYNNDTNIRIRGAALCVLAEAERPLTASEILQRDKINLYGITTQKLCVELSAFADYGTIEKVKGSDGRLRYYTMELKEKLHL